MAYNLLDKRWIPEEVDWNVLTDAWLQVMNVKAEREVCSPLEALTRAGEIRCIAAASPLDLFAAHRFLLTLLYWKADVAGGALQVRASLLAGKTPQAVLNAIERESACFRLFDEKRPFLQDPCVRNDNCKSAGSLFAEFACGTNIAHFHHGDDENMHLCLSCATMGLLRLVPWTQSGGRGLSPAVHNAPPIVAMAVGENLAATLGLNLVEIDGKAGEARWSGHFKPSDGSTPIPYMEAFTWNPRRVHLRSVQTNEICWRCGRQEVPVVGPIVYAKNDNTKSNKKSGKTIPFVWQDPSAFYGTNAPYVTIKSYDEELAANGRDLAALIGKENSRPDSTVLNNNPEHRGWQLVIPCTKPSDIKSFDHRQVDLPILSPDTIRAALPPEPPRWRQQAIDGWSTPGTSGPGGGASSFVRAALQFLSQADWAVLASAAYRPMHESPSAFDLLAGLLWSLRKKVSGLPSRSVAWLMLKLMGTVPSPARFLHDDALFCPLDALPKRQVDERRGERAARSPYPVSLPRGQRLEASLRIAIECHLMKRKAAPIDWPGLCHRLNRLLD